MASGAACSMCRLVPHVGLQEAVQVVPKVVVQVVIVQVVVVQVVVVQVVVVQVVVTCTCGVAAATVGGLGSRTGCG